MRENPYREDRDAFKEILQQYEYLRNGRSHSFIDEESFEKIIEYFDEREEMGKAIEAAELAAEQYPYSSSILLKKADLLLASGKYKEALELLEHAELLDGNNITLYILKTDALLAMDMHEKAVAVLEQALEIFEGDERIELLFELADVYDDYEEFDKVFECLLLVLKDDANNEEALYKICFWTDFTGRNEESIRLHKEIIDEYPYNEIAWFNLAAAYQGLKLYEKAIDAYQYAITIDEKFDYAYRNIGDAYIRLRKYKDAIEMLEKVLELSKPEDVIHEAIGHCYDRLKNFAQARLHYRKASHLSPGDSKLFYKIACTYFNEGQYENSIRQIENALRIHKLQPEYNLLMGNCKNQLGFFKEAVQYYTNVVRMRPKNVAGWEALIKCLYAAGYTDEALTQVKAAYQITNHKPVFLFYHSAVLFAAGKSKEALLVLEKAMYESPKLLKKFIELNPSILQNQQVVDLAARYKRNKSI
jgi:tetratricopeptide (TPR) repeat protein